MTSTPGKEHFFTRGHWPVVVMTVVTALLLLLSGCGQSSTPAANSGLAPGASPDMLVPPEIKAQKELLPVSTLFALPRINPFLSLLEAQEQEEQAQQEQAELVNAPSPTPIPPPPDPFEGFSVTGILYRDSKKSVAMVIPPSGDSKVVRTGDVLSAASGPYPLSIRVAKISKQSLTLQVMNLPPDYPPEYKSKTFTLPSLVGYNNTNTKNAGSASGTAAGTTFSSNGQAGQSSTSQSGLGQVLSNLSGGGSGSNNTKMTASEDATLKQLEKELQELAR